MAGTMTCSSGPSTTAAPRDPPRRVAEPYARQGLLNHTCHGQTHAGHVTNHACYAIPCLPHRKLCLHAVNHAYHVYIMHATLHACYVVSQISDCHLLGAMPVTRRG